MDKKCFIVSNFFYLRSSTYAAHPEFKSGCKTPEKLALESLEKLPLSMTNTQLGIMFIAPNMQPKS